jgi:hypothetical protein
VQKKDREMMVWTWAGWEPLQYYRRLGGFHETQEGNALWQDKWARQLRSRPTAETLRRAGINWVTTHFFKGFGLKVESEEIAQTAELIRNYHAEGIKVFCYIQYGTLMPETILLEEPEARKWLRTDWHGRNDAPPYAYGEQYWRVKPCGNQEGFRNYLLRCVDQAIGIGADGVWIDNLNADGCHCSACQKAFQAYLADTIKDPWREMGLRQLSTVAIPHVHLPTDPVFQAWVRFRAAELKESVKRISRHARALKPDIQVAANFGLGSHLRNPSEGGNWIGNYGDLDFIYAENHLFPGWQDGEIVTQHGPVKLGASLGLKVVPGSTRPLRPVGPYAVPSTPTRPELRRVFAESVLFGAGATNGPWGLRGENGGEEPAFLRDAQLRSDTRALADYYRSWKDKLAGSTDAAPVALFYSFEAFGFDEPRSRQAMQAMSQLLLQHQVPFRYVLSDHLDALDDVQLLILPHVLGLSDETARTLRQFVRRGGRILATGRSSLYDESLRMREDYALADIFGVRYSNAFEAEHQNSILFHDSTSCVLLPGEWGLTPAQGEPFCQIAPERVVQTIRQITGRHLLPEVLTPFPHVVFEMRRLKDHSLLLGVINYSNQRIPALRINVPRQVSLKKTDQVANEAGEKARLTIHWNGDHSVLKVSDLDVEAFAHLSTIGSR